MKGRYIKFVMMLALAVGCTAAFWSVASAANAGGKEKRSDHSEAEDCAGCHRGPGAIVMPEVVDQWELSEHGNSYDEGSGATTYCASCKSPLLADPGRYVSGQKDPPKKWQDVTCSACHPPHDLRVEWGTPIGNYNVETGDWTPVYDSNELCVFCHTGSHHAKDFQGFGQSMFDKKGVECNDCHMAEVPFVEGQNTYDIHSHTWEVEENLPYSCGVDGTGCHGNHTTSWAETQIEKAKIHDSGGNPDSWPYYPGGDSPP